MYRRCAQDAAQYIKSWDIFKHDEKKDAKEIYLVSTMYRKYAQDAAQYVKSRDIFEHNET